ncbi:hypothetical protein [Cytobacillus horneckiae]
MKTLSEQREESGERIGKGVDIPTQNWISYGFIYTVRKTTE